MGEIHNILFDLDGTLVDSSRAIESSLSYALQRQGLGFPSDLAVERLIGTPLLEIFRGTFGIAGANVESAIADYRDHYERHSKDGTHVYDRVEETLERLHGKGCRLFLATVKPSAIAAQVLREMRLEGYFSGAVGSSMDHSRRDKGDIIRHALELHGLDAGRSAMVGDRAQDIQGARRNGLYAVAVTYGFGSLEELTAAGPDHLVTCSSEIPGLFFEAPPPA